MQDIFLYECAKAGSQFPQGFAPYHRRRTLDVVLAPADAKKAPTKYKRG